jgi:siderophore synthetase component
MTRRKSGPGADSPSARCPECNSDFSAKYLAVHRKRIHGVSTGKPRTRAVSEIATAVLTEKGRATAPRLKPETRIAIYTDSDGGVYIVEKIR